MPLSKMLVLSVIWIFVHWSPTGRSGHDHMVVEFTTTYAMSAYQLITINMK